MAYHPTFRCFYCPPINAHISYGGYNAREGATHIYDRLLERFGTDRLEEVVNHIDTVVVTRENMNDYPSLISKLERYPDQIFLVNESYDALIPLFPNLDPTRGFYCYTALEYSASVRYFYAFLTKNPTRAAQVLQENKISFNNIQAYIEKNLKYLHQ